MTAIAERSPGPPVTTPEVTMAAALNQALADALTEDETVLVFGEDVGPLGGVFRVTDGLAARFGDMRVFDLGDELLVDCERVALQELFNMIRRYKLGMDVELAKRMIAAAARASRAIS